MSPCRALWMSHRSKNWGDSWPIYSLHSRGTYRCRPQRRQFQIPFRGQARFCSWGRQNCTREHSGRADQECVRLAHQANRSQAQALRDPPYSQQTGQTSQSGVWRRGADEWHWLTEETSGQNFPQARCTTAHRLSSKQRATMHWLHQDILHRQGLYRLRALCNACLLKRLQPSQRCSMCCRGL